MRRLLVIAALAVACKAGPKPVDDESADEPFRCQGRHAAYVVTGSITAPEAGITISCAGEVPTVEEYRIGDDGREDRRAGRISRRGWEEAWQAFDNAAWENLSDCENARVRPKRGREKKSGPSEPFYVFEVSDEEKQVSLSCKGHQLPHPFDTFRDALDRAKGELPIVEN